MSGHECARQSLPLVWFGLLALGVVASLLIYRAAANVALAILPTPVLIAIGVIGLMGLLSPLLKGGSEHRADRPVDILVPWASIGLVVRDDRQPGGVVMEVRNFEPKGGLHFRPDAGEAAFTTALNEARRGN